MKLSMIDVKRRLPSVGRFLATALLIVVAGVAVWQLWQYFETAARTRDGAVEADIVRVAADVSGRVEAVLVANGATVHKGQPLFRIDSERAQLAVRQRQAELKKARAAVDEAKREAERVRKLKQSHAVSVQKQEQALSKAAQAKASVMLAQANLEQAQLNLERTTVKAPVSGVVTNLKLRPGSYLDVGEGVLALVDSSSIRVVGYFDETKLAKIHVGDTARIHLMGSDVALSGHVSSMAAAINNQRYVTDANLLPSVDPNFSWIRLAQRIPVRIKLETVPADIRLIAGRTATVEIVSDPSDDESWQLW